MSGFPNTPVELLTRIASDASGENETVWAELISLYQPAMREFLRKRAISADEIEDIMQDVFVRLVEILENGKYDRRRGRFRAYLSTLLLHELIGHVRKGRARMEHRRVPLAEDSALVEPEARREVEKTWVAECHAAIVKHILENTALAGSSKRIFKELEESGDTCEAVAKRLGVSAASVRQVKSRISRMVRALEKRMLGDEG